MQSFKDLTITRYNWLCQLCMNMRAVLLPAASLFVSFPQKRNGIVFSSGVNYLHSEGNIQSE